MATVAHSYKSTVGHTTPKKEPAPFQGQTASCPQHSPASGRCLLPFHGFDCYLSHTVQSIFILQRICVRLYEKCRAAGLVPNLSTMIVPVIDHDEQLMQFDLYLWGCKADLLIGINKAPTSTHSLRTRLQRMANTSVL